VWKKAIQGWRNPLSFAQCYYLMSKFEFHYRVAYTDFTVGNHIYYGRYLDLLEKARGEFFRQLGTTFVQWEQQDALFPVIEVRIRYKAPARYDDLLTCELWVARADGVRLNFAYRIANQTGIVILEGETLHVCTGLDEKPKRLPEALTGLLTPFRVTENAPDNLNLA
jgi:acyl-CoA thioester hydrolase